MVSCFCSVPAQVPQSSPTPVPTGGTTETQKARDEAETEYFRAQTAKLKEPSSQSVTYNLPALAAILVGLVALVSFLFNYRAMIQNQKDTQFYEALKRFGDKESARLRSSAAGILTEIGLTRRWVFRPRRPYYQTALDQLLTGILLEENHVVLEAIESAIAHLIREGKVQIDPFVRLTEINEKLTKDCSSRLAEFFASAGAATENVSPSLWDQAAQMTGYEEIILRDMVGLEGFASRSRSQPDFSFKDQMRRAVSTFSAIPEDEKPQHRLNCLRALETAATRLEKSISLYGKALFSPMVKLKDEEFPHVGMFLAKLSLNSSKMQTVTFDHCGLQQMKFLTEGNSDISFLGSSLYQGDFNYMVLRKADLSYSNLTGAKLIKADLEEANLIHAKLGDAKLPGANLRSARLAFMEIDDNTDLSGANWWAADFSLNRSVDSELLKTLWKRYSAEVSEDLTDIHASVRPFVSSQRESK